MDEETKVNEQIGEAKVEEKPAEKTFTQSEVDKIVKERLKRSDAKYRRELESSKEISKLLNDTGILEGDEFSQIEALKSYKSENGDGTGNKPEEDLEMLEIKCERAASKMDDEDAAMEYELICEIPAEKRTKKDKAMLEALLPKWQKVTFGKEINSAKKYVKEKTELDFDELLSSDEFKDFSEGVNLPLKKIIEKFIKYNPNFTVKGKTPASTGTAKSTSGESDKTYYTPEEAAKLTEADYKRNPKLLDIIKNSASKWK